MKQERGAPSDLQRLILSVCFLTGGADVAAVVVVIVICGYTVSFVY